MKPLSDINIIEFSGLGPAPFAAMILADMGADVTRISRPGPTQPNPVAQAFLGRGRRDLVLDLRDPADVHRARALIDDADVLIEGYRPGKMESLGLGPADLMARNPQLVYGRMTGWGQSGPLVDKAGHDLNFLALSGILNLLGERGRVPMPPLNLVADFGGGGMYLAFGIVCALMQVARSGQGQVVDAAMVHGVTHLASLIHAQRAAGRWHDRRESNMLDGGAPFYRVYPTRDGRFIAVAALEPVFFQALIAVLETPEWASLQADRAQWSAMQASFTARFAARDLSDWVAAFAPVDACVTPVLTLDEARDHPQMRGCFQDLGGFVQPSVAPQITPWTAAPDVAPPAGRR